MLNEFKVKICKEVELDEWNLDVDKPKGRYLYLGHPIDTKIAYSVNIHGGLLLLGTDPSRALTTLELNISMSHWRRSDDDLLRPAPTLRGCLEFSNINSRHNEFDDIDPVAYTDEKNSFVNILIDGKDKQGPIWAGICDKCCANLSDDRIVGFWIDLSGLSSSGVTIAGK
jgi:hypothetical protein